MDSLKKHAEVAEKAARAAGQILLEGGASLRKVEFSDARDVKLKADQESEILIKQLLETGTGLAVYGEEFGGDRLLTKGDEYYWVVDPLDGTFNYLRGSNQCAVSIGLMKGEEPVLGVVYDFNRDCCFTGIVGEGFYINGQAHRAVWASSIDQAALSTGFPAGMDKSAERMTAFIERISPYKKVRMIGTAALALANVAAGYCDVYYEETTRLWDVAAGIALIKASGGVIDMKASPSGKLLAYDVWAAGKASFIRDV